MKYKNISLLINLLVLSYFYSYGQNGERFDFCKNQVTDLSNVENGQKFEIISKHIGDAKVVLLGEQNHGDGLTMKFKSDFVKYLHEVCDFNVILFESNFYPLQKLREDGNIDFNEVRKYIYPIWTNCLQCSDVFTYIDSTYNTPNPLVVGGIDNQKYFYQFNYVEELKKMCADNQLIINDTALFFNSLRTTLKYNSSTTIDELKYLTQCIAALRESNNDFFNQEMNNLLAYIELKKLGYRKKVKDYHYQNIRDSIMSDNALWLIKNRYPNEKVIIWAHNAHISRNTRTKSHYLGDGLHNILGDDMYSIAFTSYEGKSKFATGAIETNRLKPHSKSIESWMHSKGYEISYTDFKRIPVRNTEFRTCAFYEVSIKNTWGNIFDGLLYINTMEPCIKIDDTL